MKEKRILPYRTFYRNAEKLVMASDAYNAATGRAKAQFGGNWEFFRWKRVLTCHKTHVIIVRETKSKATRAISVM